MTNSLLSGSTLKRAGLSVSLVGTLMLGAGLDRIMGDVGEASDRFSKASNYSVIGETYDAIRENYVLQDDFTDEQLVWGAASGMIDALGDTGHSTFMNPEQTQAFNESSAGEFVGIGINYDATGDLPVVNYPIKNSPAEAAGVLPGDTLISVDGVDLRDPGVDQEEVLNSIRGEAGTDVTLQFIHAGETEPYEVTITRAAITVDPVQVAMLPGNVLWLRLEQFSDGASDRIVAGLEWGKEQGATSVVLDLRGNPGGYIAEAMAIAGQFLPAGTPLYQEMDNTGAKRVISTTTTDGAYLDGPLVVLINKSSASASELTSSALKETGRATLIGETTYGTGTVLLPFDLSDGSTALLGVELFLTGQGNDIYHVGVEPNEEVAFSENPNDRPGIPRTLGVDEGTMTQADFDALADPQLHAAVDLLTK